VDYKAERLVFRVGINGAEPTSDMKSLSGGERSLASLTFILALGELGRERGGDFTGGT
jgi:chromosome segregation ATPase